jgi:N-acetylglucosaminyldiphosphoundecaprenol N-acetyl-beta-D-mannosaminyltransferase
MGGEVQRVPLVLGARVDPTSYGAATRQVLEWARRGESRYVCVATVHSVMEAWDDPGFRQVLNAADLVTPDGMPLVWMLRRLGYPDQQRVYGPDLTLHVCEAAAREGVPVGFYGGLPEALETMVSKLRRLFPGLVVAYAWSPPFRPLSPEEDAQVVREIVGSGARVLFVGLGCPKQERWMGEHRGRVPAVMLGVGAAFDFHGGRVRQAPRWMQDRGLEWLFRLAMEPRRLWRRYLKHNPRFAVLALLQLLRERATRGPVGAR